MIRRPPRSTRTDTLFPTRRSSDLLRNIFGYRETKLRSTINTQGAGPIILGGSLFTAFIADSTQARKYITDEFQILGTAFDDRLSFIFGAFYNHDKSFEPGGSHFIAFTSDPSSIPFTTRSEEHTSELQSLMR